MQITTAIYIVLMTTCALSYHVGIVGLFHHQIEKDLYHLGDGLVMKATHEHGGKCQFFLPCAQSEHQMNLMNH